MQHKTVHILPDASILPPNLSLSLLGLGSRFIPRTKAWLSTAKHNEAIRQFVDRPVLRTANTRLPLRTQARDLLQAALNDVIVRPSQPLTSADWPNPDVLPAYGVARSVRDNLTPLQRATLRFLLKCDHIVIKDADKNLGLTVMSKSWYTTQVLKHLHDVTTYTPVLDLKVTFKLVTALLTRVNGLAWPHVPRQGGRSTQRRRRVPRLPTRDAASAMELEPCPFYIIPKVHKNPPSSRPIAAAQRFITTPLSRRLTPLLQNLVAELPYIVRNSTEFIRQLSTVSTPLPPGARLFSADVESLYPNIETAWALRLISPMIRKAYGHLHGDTLVAGMKVVLEHLYVQFEGTSYRQISGCAMGTPLAPPYANLVMDRADLGVRTLFQSKLALLCRFIDDYLGIWLGSTEEYAEFVLAMNSLHPRLRITFSALELTQPFLDISVTINSAGCIETSLYRKALNRYLYIPVNSQHRHSTLTGWVFGELLRITRASSTRVAWMREVATFWLLLRRRGYPVGMLHPVFSRVVFEQRASLLQQRRRSSVELSDDAHPSAYLLLQTHPCIPLVVQRLLNLWLYNGRVAWTNAPSLGARFARLGLR